MGDLQHYIQIDQQIHLQAQVLAKFARSLAEEKDDDSHTNLQYDVISESLTTRWVNIKDEMYRLELALNRNVYRMRSWNMSVVQQLAVHEDLGKSEHEIGAYLEANFGLEHIFEPLHYSIPEYPKQLLKLKKDEVVLKEWMRVRTSADEACQALLNHFQKGAEARIWPHHFDTSIYFEATETIGIGFGLAMADDLIDVPYFYLTPYALNDDKIPWESFAPLTLGSWFRSDDFNAGVLKIDSMELNELKQHLTNFVRSALEVIL